MKYAIGLDIGIASVGWAALDLDAKTILGLGVRGFSKAENAKDGSSLALPRRLARSARRRLRRRAGRCKGAKNLFVKYGLVQPDRITAAFETRDETTPWQLRLEGLDRRLDPEEFARALFHIVKHRGFKSNRKKVKRIGDDGKMLSAVAANKDKLRNAGHRTVGEMYYYDSVDTSDERFPKRVRNTYGSYVKTVSRDLLEEEIKTLFEAQRSHSSALAGHDFEVELLEVFNRQKPFASGDDIIKLVGYCTFEPDELRAPKNSYHSERFSLLGKVNSLTYLENGDRKRLDDDQRKIAVALAYKHLKPTYKQLRKAINLHEDARFVGLQYLAKKKPKKGEEQAAEHNHGESMECEDSHFFQLKGYHDLRKACSRAGVWDVVKDNFDLIDDLAYSVTFYKTDEDVREYLEDRGVSAEIIEAVQECEFAKSANLSTLAIKKILPHLEKGLLYNEACAEAGYHHSVIGGGQPQYTLPHIPTDQLRNPVVIRALTQARKVVNHIIARYGSPYEIHVELARDVGKSSKGRLETQNFQNENRKSREEASKRFEAEFGRPPKSDDLLKRQLYSEQAGQCAYSQAPIDIRRLLEPNYSEIDHILPRSRSFNNARSNKVLVLAAQNQNKRDSTPYEWFGHNESRWNTFTAWVNTIIKDKNKRDNLLRESFDERLEAEWKQRALSDTSWIAREFTNFVRCNLKFSDPEHKSPVRCVNGKIVSDTRYAWGLPKDREENDLHHAVDAAVIAALSPYHVQKLTLHLKSRETRESYVDPETGEMVEWRENKKPWLPQPWKGFRKEVMAKVEQVLVSRMPLRKMRGELHAETIRSKKSSENISTVKKELTSLSATDLQNLFDPEHNEALYDRIKRRMAEHGNKAKAAFEEPLYKPLKDGSDGPIVRSVKVQQTQVRGIDVRNGIADNSSMPRVDVFRAKNKKGIWQYYIVPIYVSDIVAGALPEAEPNWEFIFSLYRYDLIRLVRKEEELWGYYRGYNINRQSITICEINNNQPEACTPSIGVKNLKVFEKYQMGILGDYYPVGKETRRGLADNSDIEPGEAEG